MAVVVSGLILALGAGPGLAQDSAPQTALGTAFTYQGRLEDVGGPVDGTCDFKFRLFNAASGGTQIDDTETLTGVQVSGGLFTVQLDFGAGAFNGYPRWLEIEVRCPSETGSYVKLSPLQPLNPAPYALYAAGAPDTLEGLSCAGGQVAKWNGSAWACASDETGSGGGGGAYWSLTGNGGTNPGTDYLGTTDNKALQLKVNALGALRLEPNSTSPNLVGGYAGNRTEAGAMGAVIGGGGSSGSEQRVTDDYGTVGGGLQNRAGDADGVKTDAAYATVAGGRVNVAGSAYASVGGGYGNVASGLYSTVAGGARNDATAYGATVGGGADNQATASYATVAGGGKSDDGKPESANWATDRWGTVGGGAYNRAGNSTGSTTDAEYATVGGGLQNTANARQATVAGGAENTAGYRATVGGGLSNQATGKYGTVPGGYLNAASADHTFAAGQRAKAIHNGAFVWADSTAADFTSWQADEFAVRAGGGVRLKTDSFSVFNSAGQAVFTVDKTGAKNLGLTLKHFALSVKESYTYKVLGDFNLCTLVSFRTYAVGDFDQDVGKADCTVRIRDGLWELYVSSDEVINCEAICF